MADMRCLVVYDIEEDKARTKISEACLDFGLERIQMSAFWGLLSRTRQRELYHRIKRLLGDGYGRFFIQPICAHDEDTRFIHEQGDPGDRTLLRSLIEEQKTRDQARVLKFE
ncbi:MAG: CRISPR-associated endonuclease Cas2 [Candidatus Lindowbacteria bacterium RIFCSPLOWO2_12_FULL_62_27]|nr:MAG: CRISPR-associated endonuclease Cas2 [Candidatus Lindowbacteria bacterium RIFCSPLOWO2_02_FULL_62_12]OGH62661.1 MAG: CRISPR-associated endonuclease Cas2 [Candidatus Lindowbacteria bacterium RIFCSPLOWO2_12_FULL_62_27]